MSGPVALHGGGEFLAGDEEFLAALLARAVQRAERGRPIRVAVVPTAAARGRPDLAGRNGVEAFERVGAESGVDVAATTIPVVDRATAADAALAADWPPRTSSTSRRRPRPDPDAHARRGSLGRDHRGAHGRGRVGRRECRRDGARAVDLDAGRRDGRAAPRPGIRGRAPRARGDLVDDHRTVRRLGSRRASARSASRSRPAWSRSPWRPAA